MNNSPSDITPLRLVWLATLKQALHDAHDKHFASEISGWMARKDDGHVECFSTMCMAAGVPEDRVRRVFIQAINEAKSGTGKVKMKELKVEKRPKPVQLEFE